MESFEIAALVFFVVFVPGAAFSTTVFYWRRNIQPIKARSPNLIVFGNIVFVVFVATLSLQRVIADMYPCVLNLWQGYLGMITIANIYAVRAWTLYCHFSLTQKKLKASKDSTETISRIKEFLSPRFLLSRILGVSLPLLVYPVYATISDDAIRTGLGDGCKSGTADYVLSGYTGGYIALFMWLSFKLQLVHDAFGIKDELKNVGIGSALALPIWLVFNTLDSLADFNAKRFPVSTMALLLAITWAILQGTVIPLYRSYRETATPTKTDFQQVIPTSLRSLLNSPYGLKSFRSFCALEFAAENALFWEAAERFRKDVSELVAKLTKKGYHRKSNKRVSIEKQAILIYQQYIQSGAPLEINLPSAVQNDVEEKALYLISKLTRDRNDSIATSVQFSSPMISSFRVESHNNQSDSVRRRSVSTDKLGPNQGASSVAVLDAVLDLLLHMFDAAQDEIEKLMEGDTFPRYRRSPQYRELLEELKEEEVEQDLLKQLSIL